MAKYIDTDRLIFADGGNDNRDFDFVLRMQIDNAEAVDAVPVVRCGECKHNDGCMTDFNGFGRKDFDFCPYGERMADK